MFFSSNKICTFTKECFFKGKCNLNKPCSHYFISQNIVNSNGIVFAVELLTRPMMLSGVTVEEYFLKLSYTKGSWILEQQMIALVNNVIHGKIPANIIFVNVERYILTNDKMVEKLQLYRKVLLLFGVTIVFEITERFEYIDNMIRKAFSRLLIEDVIFAADDYCMSKVTHNYIEDYAYIKIDMNEINLGMARNYNKFVDGLYILKQGGARLIAEKIETENEYQLVRLLPFDYFQGYYFENVHLRVLS